jgi:NAD/NADP transhydrogenase beta subunit
LRIFVRASKNNKGSPLYGMPILEVDRAQSIIVLGRRTS